MFDCGIVLALQGPNGEARIDGELLHDMPFSIEYPNELLYGFRIGKRQHLLREGLVRWNWGGDIGYGLAERTVTLDAAGQPEER